MSTQDPGSGGGATGGGAPGASGATGTQTPAVVKVVKLGGEEFLLAKLEQSIPDGEYDLSLEVVFVPSGPSGAKPPICGVKDACCKSLEI